ncbi:MFS transporter [Pseudonocardia humida]|nr:MFS transporter [Pseudonocardia humida]
MPLARLRPPTAFAGLVLAFAVVMTGTTVPTPMYSLYQRELGFSAVVQTVVFAVYAVGVLAALLLFGRWSDQLGRRPLLLGGLAAALLSSLVFLVADSVPVLLVGRLLSGVSAGIFAGAATAAVIEAAPERLRSRAPAVATAANMGGLGLGPLLAGLAVQYLPAPLHLSFAVHAVAVVGCAVLVLLAPETVHVAEHPRLRPAALAVPPPVRAVFAGAVTAGFAGFAVLGLFTAIAPRIVAEITGVDDHAVAGLVVFALFAASTAAQLGLRGLPTDRALDAGCALLVVGVLVIGTALLAGSLAVLVTGAVVAGIGQGMSFSKGMAAVHARVDPAMRAAVTSSFFVVLYVAISLPVVGVGAAAQAWGLVPAALVFVAAVAVLAAVALAALLVLQRRAAKVPA